MFSILCYVQVLGLWDDLKVDGSNVYIVNNNNSNITIEQFAVETVEDRQTRDIDIDKNNCNYIAAPVSSVKKLKLWCEKLLRRGINLEIEKR